MKKISEQELKHYIEVRSQKNIYIVLACNLFFGQLGMHYFYVGKPALGVLYIFTGGLFGIGVFIDLLCICLGRFTDRTRSKITWQ